MSPHVESSAGTLPYANRPVEKTPGHWVLARAGKTVLRPGGLALSMSALKRAVIPGADVVEFAPGMGVTARSIISVGPASYVGVERDPDACARRGGQRRQGSGGEARVEGLGQTRRRAARGLPRPV